ncbi:hypothetical protein EGT74_05105 [Chitinophaga lutea]|uniref:Uncharacterized protein n=1 Tax=Chitinophaga lutea TaxID=2488634 RepID=A0A3N4PVW5_9BACT|nr:hypothetical protein [Chitinophaga lutea]RPE12923.1 hypothetical protein EGT74_05105 [Chitinophaga lutea]
MKTSSKLLIVFFILMPVLMVVFNLLLKDQFVKGNITRRRPDSAKPPVIHELKPFKYVVYNGKVVYRKGGREKTMSNNQQLRLAVARGNTYRIDIDRRWKDMLEYSYHADTLFISYKLNEQGDMDFYYWGGSTILYAPELDGVSAGDGSVSLWPCRQVTPLKVEVLPSGSISALDVNLPQLHLSVAGNAKVDLQQADIDTLAYDLKAQSELSIKQSYTIKALKPGMVDSTSIISISASAARMVEMVPSGLHAPKTVVTKQ